MSRYGLLKLSSAMTVVVAASAPGWRAPPPNGTSVQTAAASSAPALAAAAPATAIEEVVVTAERRRTSLQKTPVAVTKIGSAELLQSGAHLVSNLAGEVPNVQVPRGGLTPTTQTFFIRGLGTSDPIQDPAVGVYVDDIYIPRPISDGGLFRPSGHGPCGGAARPARNPLWPQQRCGRGAAGDAGSRRRICISWPMPASAITAHSRRTTWSAARSFRAASMAAWRTCTASATAPRMIRRSTAM
ncbi:MAG: Plug domain-containing protein [Rhodospirillales bacterium]